MPVGVAWYVPICPDPAFNDPFGYRVVVCGFASPRNDHALPHFGLQDTLKVFTRDLWTCSAYVDGSTESYNPHILGFQ